MKQDKKTIKTYFEKGDVPTEEQFVHLIDSYIDSKQETGKPNRRFVIDENGEVTVTEEQRLPEYSLTKISNNKIGLVKNNSIIQEIDLSNYIDDTNLARLVSGTVDTDGIATFKRDDNSTFTVDFSNLPATSLSIDSLSDAQSNFNSILIGTEETPYSEGETRGINNIVIGKDAILDGVGDDNVLIGKSVLGGLGNNGNNNSNNNVVIGSRAAEDRVNFNDNVIIGGNSVTTDGSGSRNIIIGSNIEIGGHNISNQLNIGNTIKGDLSTKTIEIEKLKLTELDEGNSETDQYITIDSSGAIRKVDQQNTNNSNQLQADWNQTDDTQTDFIKNKTQTIERTVIVENHKETITTDTIEYIYFNENNPTISGLRYKGIIYNFNNENLASNYRIDSGIIHTINPHTGKANSVQHIYHKLYNRFKDLTGETLPHWSYWGKKENNILIPISGFGGTSTPNSIGNYFITNESGKKTTGPVTVRQNTYDTIETNKIATRRTVLNNDNLIVSEEFFIDDKKIENVSSWKYLETTSDLINNGEGEFPFITSKELDNLIPEYTLSEITNNKLALLKNNTIVKEIDLNTYLDDTNLARLVSGTVDTNGIATFKREDNSTFTVDFSTLLNNTESKTPDLKSILEEGNITDKKDIIINSPARLRSQVINTEGLLCNANGGTTTLLGKSFEIKNDHSERGLQIIANSDRINFKTPVNKDINGGTDKMILYFTDNRNTEEVKVADFLGRVSGKTPKDQNDFTTKQYVDNHSLIQGSGILTPKILPANGNEYTGQMKGSYRYLGDRVDFIVTLDDITGGLEGSNSPLNILIIDPYEKINNKYISSDGISQVIVEEFSGWNTDFYSINSNFELGFIKIKLKTSADKNLYNTFLKSNPVTNATMRLKGSFYLSNEKPVLF
ncbi:hypothetical protein [Tenacibaculum sp. M341]|uniref:hypothetical protein n=1 Tax=Tenacibaculum sp. M341 TaxID=2530339 RepID=UPI0010475F37|nr:hypothetical protein [Tenacibaculum sp. M341]TCI92285.1 hypothetical protein EYW44_08880 [Tenacibaculum sp. M341]